MDKRRGPDCNRDSSGCAGSFAQKLPWFGTVRARLGFEPIDRVLFYATGGLAYGEVDTSAAFTVTATSLGGTATTTASESATNTEIGWTVGGGIEWAFWERWSVKVEYLYIDFGTFNNTLTGFGAFPTIMVSLHVYRQYLPGQFELQLRRTSRPEVLIFPF